MKKFMIYALAVAALSCGCTKELNNENVVPEDGATTTVIKASVATKTVLDGTKVKWVAGDQICVNGETSDALTIAEPAASVDFTFGSDLAAEKKAVYPASFWTSDGTITLPATQKPGTSASFDTGVEPLCAYAASGNTLAFSHTCAIIKVQLKVGADDDEISYVEFSGNNDEQVSGAFTINYSTGALASTSSADGDKKVQVTVGQALTSTVLPVYIVVPAGNYSAGFKIRVEDEKHHVMTRRVGAVTLAAGHIYPLPVDTFDDDTTLKAFAKAFVGCLNVWENTIGKVDADGTHNGAKAWTDVHVLPIINPNKGYTNAGNQYDASLYSPFWSAKVGDVEYSSNQCWEIAIRGLMNLCTSEGEAFLAGMTDRNMAYTLANGLTMTSYIPSYSAQNKWNAYPWYESDNTVKDNGNPISAVDINFLLKCGSWHVVRGLVSNSGNTPLNAIGNFQEFGTSSGTLKLGKYVGYICPIRELLIAARIYKYIIDNEIYEDVYDAIKDQTFAFDLY